MQKSVYFHQMKKVVGIGIGRLLLDEQIKKGSPRSAALILKNAQGLYDMAVKYNCYRKAKNSIIKYQKDLGQSTLTGTAFGIVGIDHDIKEFSYVLKQI
jgi:hypothetical protein